MRIWPTLLPILVLLIGAAHAAAGTGWLQLDDPPPENADPQVPDPADMLDLHFGSNETHLFFRMDLVAAPDLASYTYAVTLDIPTGGAYGQDYRLVYAQGGSYIEAWDGTAWVYLQDMTVTLEDTSHLIYEVPMVTFGGVGNVNAKAWFETYEGADSFSQVADRAPNGGGYLINHKTIPNLPWLVLPIFAAALAGAVALLWYRRKARGADGNIL